MHSIHIATQAANYWRVEQNFIMCSGHEIYADVISTPAGATAYDKY